MAEPGAVGWQFKRQGVILVDGRAGEDEVMLSALEAGAEDVADEGGMWRITCDPSRAFEVKAALEASGFEVISADAPMVSETLVPVTDIDDAKKVLRIMEAIEDNEDVQDVYSNFDMDDDVLEAAAG
jgi:transcriptional/translational regulatory protein YebC/TACO1